MDLGAPMAQPADAAGFVLAGGRSSRMGRDKALLTLAGETMLAVALRTLRAVAREVSILGDRPDLAVHAPVMPDVHPGCGPLGGVEAALRVTRRPWNLIVGVDTPFLTPALLQLLLSEAAKHRALVCAPVVGGLAQPLCAVYHRALLPEVERAIAAGRLRVTALFERCGSRLHLLDDEALALHGVAPEVFDNLNTPEEFAAAEARVQGRNKGRNEARA